MTTVTVSSPGVSRMMSHGVESPGAQNQNFELLVTPASKKLEMEMTPASGNRNTDGLRGAGTTKRGGESHVRD